MNELALFAGAGGGILGGHLLGWRTVCAVERDAYAAGVLLARQNDGCIPPFPIWDDVCTFDGRAWRGLVDVVSGGFPCQDISVAGRGAGIDGARSGLWSEMSRIIGEVRPRFVLEEESASLQTLPRWGTAADGELWELQILERLTSENESGLWPTPTSSEGTKIPARANYGQIGLNNHPRIRGLPTRPKGEKSRKWATPTAHNSKEAGSPAEFTRNTPTLTAQAHGGIPTQPMPLNPVWVEWLMGWPLGWTDFAPLEMDRFQQWLHAHSLD